MEIEQEVCFIYVMGLGERLFMLLVLRGTEHIDGQIFIDLPSVRNKLDLQISAFLTIKSIKIILAKVEI